MKLSLFLVILFSSTQTLALSSYYPKEFVERYAANDLDDRELKEELFSILSMAHVSSPKERDTLKESCTYGEQNCTKHFSLGYKGARKQMFGNIFLEQDSRGYFIEGRYCQRDHRDGVGPLAIPDHTKFNCEHLWPQSKFSKTFPKDLQKSDLHHLFPTESRVNSTRGNVEFAEVSGGSPYSGCEPSKFGGVNHKRANYFEPPALSKGDVARALFYFSTRYKIAISQQQEKFLRKWHEEDPVSDEERIKNNKVHELQNNRNPFIDIPELVFSIENF